MVFDRSLKAQSSRTCKILHTVAVPIPYREIKAGRRGGLAHDIDLAAPYPFLRFSPFPILDIIGLIATLDANPYLASLVKSIDIASMKDLKVTLKPDIAKSHANHLPYVCLDSLAARLLGYDSHHLAVLKELAMDYSDPPGREELKVIAMGPFFL